MFSPSLYLTPQLNHERSLPAAATETNVATGLVIAVDALALPEDIGHLDAITKSIPILRVETTGNVNVRTDTLDEEMSEVGNATEVLGEKEGRTMTPEVHGAIGIVSEGIATSLMIAETQGEKEKMHLVVAVEVGIRKRA
jgi:hypothetical protein